MLQTEAKYTTFTQSSSRYAHPHTHPSMLAVSIPYPPLSQYACDGDDKTWLYENKHLPVHGGKVRRTVTGNQCSSCSFLEKTCFPCVSTFWGVVLDSISSTNVWFLMLPTIQVSLLPPFTVQIHAGFPHDLCRG